MCRTGTNDKAFVSKKEISKALVFSFRVQKKKEINKFIEKSVANSKSVHREGHSKSLCQSSAGHIVDFHG